MHRDSKLTSTVDTSFSTIASDTVDAILALESGGLVMGIMDNMGKRRSTKDGNGFVQKTLGMFSVTSSDALRFAGSLHRNLLKRDTYCDA